MRSHGGRHCPFEGLRGAEVGAEGGMCESETSWKEKEAKHHMLSGKKLFKRGVTSDCRAFFSWLSLHILHS